MVKFKQISYDPIFYFDGPLVLPEVVVPAHREGWISQMKDVRRYEFKNYPAIIQDHLLAHTHRVIKRALVLPYLDQADILNIADMLMVHDVGEIGKPADMTVVDKGLNSTAAKDSYDDEIKTAKRLLSVGDYQLWLEYETAKPLLEGRTSPFEYPVSPNAIVAKVVDVLENETYFHSWFEFLKDKYGPFAKGMFPPKAFNLTFPRLRLYQSNLSNLRLPPTHFTVIEELLAEIEAYGRVAEQVED